MEMPRALEEIHRQVGAAGRETQWTDAAFAWRPRRLRHRVEARSAASDGLQIVSIVDVTERVRATPDRVRLVLGSMQVDSGRYLFDHGTRSICSRAEFDVGCGGEELEPVARMLLRQIDEAERQAAQFARILAGRIPIIRARAAGILDAASLRDGARIERKPGMRGAASS